MSRRSGENREFQSARAVFEILPGAVSLWSRDRSLCLFNDAATQLIKYVEADFLNHPSLWIERIHPADRAKFCRIWKDLGKRKSPAQCDYRFFPKNANAPIWIREKSGLRRDKKREALEVITAYTDISDLKRGHDPEIEEQNLAEMGLLIHNFQNSVQKVSLEVELALMDLKRRCNGKDVISAVDSISNSLRGLLDHVVKAGSSTSVKARSQYCTASSEHR